MLNLLLYFVLWVVLDIAFFAIFCRRRKGKFKLDELSNKQFTISSDFGRFTFDLKSSNLIYREKGRLRSLNFSEIEGIEHNVSEKYAFLSEPFYELSIFNLRRKNRDTNKWHVLIIRAGDQLSVPIFTVGQYQPREYLFTWYIELQARFLDMIGVFSEASEHADSTQRSMQELFRKAGIRYHLVKPQH